MRNPKFQVLLEHFPDYIHSVLRQDEKNKNFYSFDGLDSLIALAKEVKRRWDGKAPSSDVYYMLGKYYLSIDEYGNGGEPVEFPYIREFARAVTADFSVYLSEHAIEVAKGDGIELFSSL